MAAMTRVLHNRLLRQFAIALLALGLAGTISGTSTQDLVATGPAVKSFRLGAFEVSVLRDGGLVVPNDRSVFARNAKPSAVAKVLGDAGAPADKIRLDIDALLIRMPDHLVLVDTATVRPDTGSSAKASNRSECRPTKSPTFS